MKSHVKKLIQENEVEIENIKKVIFIDGKNNLKRVFILFSFFCFAFFIHNISINYKLELISATFLLIIFLGIIVYEYKSLFKKNLPKIEYFTNIFFIVFFTILLFSTIYSVKLEESGKSYFIQNGVKGELSYSDAVYFSVVTIATVGYGDIAPVGIFRYFVIVEIILGLIFIGTMVFILTKHLDQ